MIRIEDFMQLKAFARQDGMMLAALWIASFACITMAHAGILSNILALATPLLVGWRTVRFRDNILGGVISMRRAFAFAFYMFIYASLVFALAQFVYFRFIDGGAFTAMISESMHTLTPIYEQNGISKEQITNSIQLIQMLTPIQWAFMFLMQDIIIGAVVSVPIAAVCHRSMPML